LQVLGDAGRLAVSGIAARQENNGVQYRTQEIYIFLLKSKFQNQLILQMEFNPVRTPLPSAGSFIEKGKIANLKPRTIKAIVASTVSSCYDFQANQ